MKPILLSGALLLSAAPALATTSQVPEPGAITLLGAAALGAVIYGRLRRRP